MSKGSPKVEAARMNELYVLYYLRRFGWLTSQQIGMLIWGTSKNANAMALRTLKRLHENMFIECEPLANPKFTGWYLLQAGVEWFDDSNPGYPLYGFVGEGRFNSDTGHYMYLMESSQQYHRLIGNWFLIHIEQDLLPDFSFIQRDGDSMITFPEVVVQHYKNRIANVMECLPDSFVKVDEIGISVEVERTARGPLNHGKKLYAWLDIYLQRLAAQGEYAVDFYEIKEIGALRNMYQVFVCNSAKEFRNIWRYVDEVVVQRRLYGKMDVPIYYLVMDGKERWNQQIFDGHHVYKHMDAEDDVRDGERTFRLSDDQMIEILEERRDTQITVKALCQKNGIDIATLYRWNQKFKVFQTQKNKRKSGF